MSEGAVAVITDIHANLPALQAALARIDELGIERVYCGGDLVGYGPRPNEVCKLIERTGIPTIYGNYDCAIARDLEDCGCAYVDPHDRELGQKSVGSTLAHTDHASKEFMRGLPFDIGFEVGGVQVHLVHGSPRKVNEYLFEEKPASLYERLAKAEEARVLVFGHTHRPWIHPLIRDMIAERVEDLAHNKIDAIRMDTTAHRWRLAKLLPQLIEEFAETRPAEVIRGCADRVLDGYDDVPIRSHILTLAHRQTCECLRHEHCEMLERAAS